MASLPALDDPAAVLAALQAARLKMLLGQRVTYLQLDDRRVDYYPASLADIDQAIAAVSGDAGQKRHAFRLGSFARRGWMP